MIDLFLLDNELYMFKVRHPEYKKYYPVYDNEKCLAGYIASVK